MKKNVFLQPRSEEMPALPLPRRGKGRMKSNLFLWAAATLICSGAASAQTRFVSEEAQNRKALLEEYTAIHCSWCPYGHEIAATLHEKYPDDLFLMNVHAGSLAIPTDGEIDLRTPYGEDLALNSGLGGYPAGSINRHVFSGSATALDRDKWTANVPKILAMPSCVNIAAKGTLDWESRTLSVTVQLYYTDNSSTTTNYIHVAVLQDNIIGTQSGASANPAQVLEGGMYIHHHAFRDFLTGQWGDGVTTTAQGSFVEKTYTKILPETIGNVNLEFSDLHFIAFVTEGRNEVLNVCNVEIESINTPEHYVALHKMEQNEAKDLECETTTYVDITLEPRIASTPITSITFAFESEAGTSEVEYTTDSAMTQDRTYTVSCGPVKIHANGKNEQLTARIVKINGQDYIYNAQTSAEVTKSIGYSVSENITVQIWQDRYGEDITWELVQADNGTVLAKGGPYPNLSANTPVQRTTQATLTAKCYVFTIHDKGKDGINNSYGAGHLEIIDATNTPIVSNDGKYKESWRCLVKKSGVANESAQSRSSLRLSPNPAQQQSVLSFELPTAQKVRIRIIANSGACVLDLGEMALSAGEQSLTLPVTQLSEGMYFVQVQGEILNLTQKLVIVR